MYIDNNHYSYQKLKNKDVVGGSSFNPTAKARRKCAFTLAETLITLVIVGIVAALTIPNLIVKYQKEQTVTKLKKAYSTLSQTTNRAIADNGPIATWEIGRHNSVDDTIIFVNKYLVPYLNVLSKATHTELKQITYLHGQKTNFYNYAKFTLVDGVAVYSIIYNTGDDKRLIVYTDINGDKKPNKVGRDIFRFEYYIYHNNNKLNGKFLPWGYFETRTQLIAPSTDMCNKANSGVRCAALIMKDGWQIKDDYPW